MPLSTNSDAFRSPKKSVCKFDDFDCPQLYIGPKNQNDCGRNALDSELAQSHTQETSLGGEKREREGDVK